MAAKPPPHGRPEVARDRLTFLCTQLAFWLLAATDGHAKNYSVFLGRGDVYTVTPLYDVISLWPYIGDAPGQFRWRKAALAVAVRSNSAHYSLHTIQARHWASMAAKNGGAPVWQALCELVGRVEAVLDALQEKLPDAFPAKTFDAVAAGMRAQAHRFQFNLGWKKSHKTDPRRPS